MKIEIELESIKDDAEKLSKLKTTLVRLSLWELAAKVKEFEMSLKERNEKDFKWYITYYFENPDGEQIIDCMILESDSCMFDNTLLSDFRDKFHDKKLRPIITYKLLS